jgi:hypothetical protein
MTDFTEQEPSPLRRQAADVLKRARRLPVGPHRNDLRQLAIGLLWLERRGAVDTHGRGAVFPIGQSAKSIDLQQSVHDLDVKAEEALEAARAMPAGQAKMVALKRAGLLRKAADDREIRFARRGRPPKE